MGHHGPIEVTSTSPYEFTSRNKLVAMVMIAIGLLSVIVQFATHHEQTWANLLWNNFLFLGMALGATFFLAVQYVAEVGWSAVIKRPLEAMGQSIPVAGIIMILIVVNSLFLLIVFELNVSIQSLLQRVEARKAEMTDPA